MKRLRNFVRDFFNRPDPEYAYYAQAQDLIDLELRQRKVDRGEAPFQTRKPW